MTVASTETHMPHVLRVARIGIFALILTLAHGIASAQICTPYLASLPKESRLFLYFPTTDDPTFPTDTLDNISGVTSQPLTAFTPANLDADLTATAAQLRDRVTEQVRDSYCEFSVDVIASTSEPNPTGTAWQVVGIGADSSGTRVGRAQDVDTGDADTEDYARVWARGFHDAFGGAGEALSPANATLERWATAVAGTVAHEAGHNYGLDHAFSAPRTGEDMQNNHLLATGSTGLTGEQRVTRRHFSDMSFEILAHNLGLNTKTLSNWDFVNPNSSDATGLRLRLLTTAGSLALTRVYNGDRSPWTNPTLTQQPGTQSFRGTTYNIFDLTFSTGKTWTGGASGVVPAGAEFHVGAGVDADATVYDVFLTDAGGDMDLHPRMAGYAFGLNDSLGDGLVRFFADEAGGDLLVENVQVRFLPRPISLSQMVEGGSLIAEDGLPVQPFSRRELAGNVERPIRNGVERAEIDGRYDLPVAHLTDRRHLDLTIKPTAVCDENNKTVPRPDSGPFDRLDATEEEYCAAGDYISLFPATSVYVTATVVDPDARFFDPGVGDFVEGRLESNLFVQFAGVIPDFNRNGRDDYRDIRDGGSRDENGNGIPDEAEVGEWSVYGVVGVTVPEDSRFDGDLSFNVGIDRHFGGHRSLGLKAGLHRFEVAAGRSDFETVELSLRGDQSFDVAPNLRLFVGGGVGVYDYDPGDTEVGGHAGFGAGWRVSSHLDLELRFDYHKVDADFDADFATAQAGLRVRF